MSNQSKVSQEINDAYFTKDESALFCQSALDKHGWLGGSILEPCVDGGSLVSGLSNVTALDINDYGYPLNFKMDFFDYQTSDRYDLVFTNPPFGRAGSVAGKILNHATNFSDRVAFILPQSFRKISLIDRINPWFHPVSDLDLPTESYVLPDGSERVVRTCFQMWERRDYERQRFNKTPYTEFFSRVSKTDGEYAFRTQGSSAGKILKGIDHTPASTAFLVGGRELVEEHDWTSIARFSAGIPAIGLHDVAWGLRSDNIDNYLKHGIMSNMINHNKDK